MKTLIVTGAYGRTAKEADWVKGLDFQIFERGPYFSIRDWKYIQADGYTKIAFCDLRTGETLFTVEL
jgi:hypothetical protein